MSSSRPIDTPKDPRTDEKPVFSKELVQEDLKDEFKAGSNSEWAADSQDELEDWIEILIPFTGIFSKSGWKIDYMISQPLFIILYFSLTKINFTLPSIPSAIPEKFLYSLDASRSSFALLRSSSISPSNTLTSFLIPSSLN